MGPIVGLYDLETKELLILSGMEPQDDGRLDPHVGTATAATPFRNIWNSRFNFVVLKFSPPEDAYTVHLVKQRVYEMEDNIKVDHHTENLWEGVD
jgi:hypothetical protein